MYKRNVADIKRHDNVISQLFTQKKEKKSGVLETTEAELVSVFFLLGGGGEREIGPTLFITSELKM